MELTKIKLMVELHCCGHITSWAVQQLLEEKELAVYRKMLNERLHGK
jgi:hypothetical protein